MALATLALCFFIVNAAAATYHTERTVLDNGLVVLVTEMPQSKTAAVYALVKAGSATEGEFEGAGISHFLEHMMFKGTGKRDTADIASEIQAVGGSINASTDKDHTLYTITVPADAFDTALDVISDMMTDPAMNEFELERDVILNEMRMHEDNPDREVNTLTFRDFYREHPYRHPVIGYPEQFKQISREDLFEYYHRFYVPNNMVLSIAGPVDTATIMPKIEAAFKNFTRGPSVSRNLAQEPGPISPRVHTHPYPTDMTRLTVSFAGVRLLDDDCYALDVLAQILGQGASSRLYGSLYKDKKLVYEVSAGNYTPVDSGMFVVDATLETAQVTATIAEIKNIVAGIAREGIKPAELEIAKKDVARERVFSIQTPAAVAYRQAFDESMTGDPNFSDKYVEMITRVTSDDVRRVALKYLDPAKWVVTILEPTAAAATEENPRASVPVPETRRYTLKNGTTVLLREDHALPIVNFRVVYYGGTRIEPTGKSGLSQATAMLLTRGTRQYPAKQWNELTARFGLAFSAFSGQNTLGITLDCLSSDMTQGWKFLRELLFQPAFDQNELVSVKTSMLAAIRQRKDSIYQTAALALRGMLFPGHPLQYDPLGTPETLDGISVTDVRAFFTSLQKTNKPVIAVYGDVSADTILPELEKLFGAIAPDGEQIPLFTPQDIAQPCEFTEQLDKEQSVIVMGFRAGTLFDQERYATDLVAEILGSAFDGRLFRAIREKEGKAYAVGADFTPSLETGFFSLFALTSPADEEVARAKMKEEAFKLAERGITDDELNSVKKYIKGNHLMSRESNGQRATLDALNELYGLGADWDERYAGNIDKVTPEEIKQLAQKLFVQGMSCRVSVKRGQLPF